jgi:acetate kinase
MGIMMDYELNKRLGSKEGVVSFPYSHTAILVIPTNEELQIATDVYELLHTATTWRKWDRPEED